MRTVRILFMLEFLIYVISDPSESIAQPCTNKAVRLNTCSVLSGMFRTDYTMGLYYTLEPKSF